MNTEVMNCESEKVESDDLDNGNQKSAQEKVGKKGLPQYISEKRHALGMSQREFSELLGITQTSLCNLELGKCQRPTKRVVKALADFLDLPLAKLEILSGYTVNAVFGNTSEKEEYQKKLKNTGSENKEVIMELTDLLNDKQNLELQRYINSLYKTISNGPDDTAYSEAVMVRNFLLKNFRK